MLGKEEFIYAHQKLDGIWLHVTPDHAWSGHPTDLLHCLQFCPTVMKAVNAKHQFYGELYVPGYPASFVKTAIKNEDPRLTFMPFALPELRPWEKLEEVEGIVNRSGLEFCPYEKLRDGLLETLLSTELPHDCEGYVFKNGNLLDWTKWKPIRTIDCVIVGYQEGQGKYLGQTGSLIVAVYTPMGILKVIANVSGMDDLTRADITVREEELLGTVVEVEYQYVGAKGRLRHPRFVRLRDDKIGLDCTMDQDPALKE
jgi:hypothetical protein